MKKIMMRAWEIAKQAVKKFGGRAIEYIAMALRNAWEEAKSLSKDITERIDELTAMGFNRWQKNGMDRMYINASTLGLTCTYYQTGNIRTAEFDGIEISNAEARRMKGSKTYIDLVKRQIVSDNAMLAGKVAELIGAKQRKSWDTIIDL